MPRQYSTACSTLSTAKISNPSIFCFGLFAFGTGLLIGAVFKRRARRQSRPASAGTIRPEFAMMREIVRPLIMFALAVFAAKLCFFYMVLGGDTMLPALAFAGLLYVLAAYAVWTVAATTRRPTGAAPQPDTADRATHAPRLA